MTALLKVVPGSFSHSGKKDYINVVRSSEPKFDVLFTDFIHETVRRKARRRSKSFVNNYNSLLKLLDAFCRQNDCVLFTNSINEEFMDDFITFMEDREHRPNYISSMVGIIKTTIGDAGKYGYAIDPTYNDVVYNPDDDNNAIYLSMNDITRIYYFDRLTKFQAKVRDLFVIGCLTAMRYSDYSTLTIDNIKGDFIDKITQKTGKRVIVPLHDYIKEILKKYNGKLPGGYSIQYFDRAIKKICRMIGFTDEIKYSVTTGRKTKDFVKEEWEMIASHTARRSGATNLYLTKRLHTFEIMQITGHTTEKSFFRYIRIKQEDAIKHIAADPIYRK